MAELGWQGLILPEEYGGAGLDFVDLVVVLEEMGRAVLPGPSCRPRSTPRWTLLDAGTEAQKKKYLPRIASGDLLATVAILEPSGRWDAEASPPPATADGGGYRLDGTKLFRARRPRRRADHRRRAQARHDRQGRHQPVLCRGRGAGVKRTALKTMDQTRKLSEIVLTGVKVGKDALVGKEGEAGRRSTGSRTAARSRSAPRPAAARSRCSTCRSPTPRCASSSASRSAPSRRSSTSAPT